MMKRLLPLTLLVLVCFSCKKEDTERETATVIEELTICDYTGWSIEIDGEPPMLVIATNLPDEFKVPQKKISFVKGRKLKNTCPPQMSYRVDRYEVKQVTAN